MHAALRITGCSWWFCRRVLSFGQLDPRAACQGHVCFLLQVRKLLLAWDLFSVLSTLTEAPFELLGSASLLSIKATFLLAYATSRPM